MAVVRLFYPHRVIKMGPGGHFSRSTMTIDAMSENQLFDPLFRPNMFLLDVLSTEAPCEALS